MPTSNQHWGLAVRPADSQRRRGRPPALGRRVAAVGNSALGHHDIFGVHLALDEALVNAIFHGNAHDETKRVRFACRLSPERIHVEITDEGPGFDPDSLPDPTTPARRGRPGGRGVLLMRAFMSRVEFCDHGSRVVLEKVRDAVG